MPNPATNPREPRGQVASLFPIVENDIRHLAHDRGYPITAEVASKAAAIIYRAMATGTRPQQITLDLRVPAAGWEHRDLFQDLQRVLKPYGVAIAQMSVGRPGDEPCP